VSAYRLSGVVVRTSDSPLVVAGSISGHDTTLPGYFSDRCPSLVGKLSWDVTTTQVTQPCILPGSLNRVPASAGVNAGKSLLPGGK